MAIVDRQYRASDRGVRVWHEDVIMVLYDHDDADCDRPLPRRPFLVKWEEVIDERVGSL